MPSPTADKGKSKQPEVEPEGDTGAEIISGNISNNEEVQFWMRETDSSQTENQSPHDSPERFQAGSSRSLADQGPRENNKQSGESRGRQMGTHKGVNPELPRALDEDSRNVALQQQLLNSILEANSEVLERIKEEAKERTYAEFLEWREKDRRKRIEAADNQNKAAKSDGTGIKQATERQESVAVSNTMVQRLGRIAGEKVKPTQEGRCFQSKHPIDYLAPSSHLGKILVGTGGNPPSDSGLESSDDDENPDRRKEGSTKGKEVETTITFSEEMKLKPIKPTKYDGAMNPRKFLRFSKEAYRLVKDGKVPKHRQVDIVSYYLEGKTYSFYERTCGDCPEEWVLKDFLIQLYNYVFPLSYRTEQRRKLKTLTQHGRRIREYVGEFEDLCDVIGMTDEREMVTLLWDGFDSSISAGLYNRDLHPERSSLKDVIGAAEMVELVEGVRKNASFGKDNRGNRSRSKEPDRESKRSEAKSTYKPDGQKSQDKGENKSGKTYHRKDKQKPRKTLLEAEKKEYSAAAEELRESIEETEITETPHLKTKLRAKRLPVRIHPNFTLQF
ncbi:hypothetical protein AAF712_009149 [Marasmius tenuissimus]|uniref:Retrotransposon gag domain-containing protein n=1 Tax=Marasmius tenuissimus TaxID=585030 RepID=A0ABR2ZSE9_9AGAR